MRKTRISRTPDVHRMGMAMSYPGIDPRTWVSLAVALGDSVVDKDHGVYVDVQLLPTGETMSARVSADYVGQGFGFYAKIKDNDDLVVVVPSGDSAHGPVVVARLWSAADTPPTEATDDPTEVMLVIEKDKSLRLKVTGSGKLFLDAPDVSIGDVEADDSKVTMLDGSKSVTIAENLQDLYEKALVGIKAIFDNHTHSTGTGPSGPPLAPNAAFPAWDSAINSTKIKMPNG